MIIHVKHVGRVKKLVGIFFGSVRLLVKFGSSPTLVSKLMESSIMNLWILCGILYFSNMWGMMFWRCSYECMEYVA